MVIKHLLVLVGAIYKRKILQTASTVLYDNGKSTLMNKNKTHVPLQHLNYF
jgi:hypothetical protein